MKGSFGVLSTEKELTKLIDGLEKKLESETELTIALVTYTKETLLAILEADRARYSRVREIKLLEKKAIADRDAHHAGVRKRLEQVKRFVSARFPGGELLDFGMKEKKKPRKLTAEEQQLKVRRARATRARNKAKKGPRPA